MIVVNISLCVFPEKQLELVQTLSSMIAPTTKDTGCMNCTVLNDIEDKNRFCLSQEWCNREDLDRYMKSDRFSVILGTNTLLSEPLVIRIDTVSKSEGMEAVKFARKKTKLSNKTKAYLP